MSQTFRSLAEILRFAQPAQEVEAARSVSELVVGDAVTSKVSVAPLDRGDRLVEWCASLALVRLAVKEAYERAARRVLEVFAHDVLARELALEPVDIEALVRRSIEAFAADEPVAVVLSAADAERVSSDLPIRVDPALAQGDLVLVVRDGKIDARLGLRAEVALDEALG